MTTRTLIFNFDGTWNGRDDSLPTNVLKLHRGLHSPTQVSFYFAGPGNEDESNVFEHFLGGAFGLGSNDIRDQALDLLRAVYRPGDRIAAIGFSRGAAIARMFAAELFEQDINGHAVNVCFLGCFDTVGAYLPFGPSQQGLFHNLTVSPSVEIAVHAVALDEDREAFEPNLMNAREGVTEVWFRGTHSDIGGGTENSGLSDTTLQWMRKQLAMSNIFAGITTHPDPDAPVSKNGGWYRRSPREVGVKVDGVISPDLEAKLYAE